MAVTGALEATLGFDALAAAWSARGGWPSAFEARVLSYRAKGYGPEELAAHLVVAGLDPAAICETCQVPLVSHPTATCKRFLAIEPPLPAARKPAPVSSAG